MLRSASLMISSTGSVPSILETASAASRLAVAQRHQRGDGLPRSLCGGGVRSSARHVFQVDAGGKAFGDLIFQFQHDPLGQLGADAGRGLEGFVVARRDGQRHTVGLHDSEMARPTFAAHTRHRR